MRSDESDANGKIQDEEHLKDNTLKMPVRLSYYNTHREDKSTEKIWGEE